MYFKDEEEYKKYLDKNKIDNNEKNLIKYTQNFFEFSKEGDILLRKNNYQDSQIDVEQYCACKQWILLNDGKTMCLLKNSFGDIYRDLPLKDYYIALYNNILMPQIANQLQNESAIYYFAKIINKENQKDNRRYILTLDFKNKDENLLLGEEILGDYSNTLNINEILEKLENYLKEKNIPLENIRRIKTDFIKQSFFKKLYN